MYDSWTCLMVQRGPGLISDEMAAALKMAACDLHLQRWDTMHIVHDVCDGIIRTDWNTCLVGTRSGVLFRAQIDADEGDFLVNFLLNEEDLERGAKLLREATERGEFVWGRSNEKLPCPQLYEFYDLRRSVRQLQ